MRGGFLFVLQTYRGSCETSVRMSSVDSQRRAWCASLIACSLLFASPVVFLLCWRNVVMCDGIDSINGYFMGVPALFVPLCV